MASTETIFALSTVTGRAALAVVRLSGPGCDGVLRALGVKRLRPPAAAVRRIYHPETAVLLDEALVLRFAAPHTYSGEDGGAALAWRLGGNRIGFGGTERLVVVPRGWGGEFTAAP